MPEHKDEPRIAILALIRGRVQGVGFRYEARSIARSLGLVGWISNLSDGGVETYAEGATASINRYRNWLNTGPPGAVITSVDVIERHPKGELQSFTVE